MDWSLNAPPCARYEGGEDDDRLIKIWLFVAGLVGGGANMTHMGRQVARLYDYKGSLIVATRERLPARVEAMFRYAWSELGNETEEAVQFHDAASADWATLWGLRRFQIDSRP